MQPLNVVSLCDGLGTGHIALEKAGIPYNYYIACEIDKYCVKVSQHNYPKTIHMGDIYKFDPKKIPFKIDLVFCGFPCQGFSRAGKQLKFDDPRSQTFFQGVRVLAAIMKRNPDCKFLFENVRMDKDTLAIISNILGVKPFYIDSELVCAQTRKRWYFTNIKGVELPEDRGIILADILEDEVDERYNLSAAALARINTDEVYKKLLQLKLQRDKAHTVLVSVARQTLEDYVYRSKGQLVQVVAKVNNSQDGKVFAVTGRAQCLSAGHNNTPKVVQLNPAKEFGSSPQQQNRKYDSAAKSPTLTSTHAAHIKTVVKLNIHGKTKKNQFKAACDTGGANYGGNHSDMDVIAIGVVNNYGTLREVYNGKSLNIDANYHKGQDTHGARTLVAQGYVKDVVVHNLQPRQAKGKGGKGHLMRYPGNKAYCLDTANGQAIEYDMIIRRLTPVEVCRLQGVPDSYFYTGSGQLVSDSQIYKMIGNGWQSDTIAHILSYLKK